MKCFSNLGPFLTKGITWTCIRITTWVSDYIHMKRWGLITHTCSHFNCGLTKLLLRLGYGWFHTKWWIQLLLYVLILVCVNERDVGDALFATCIERYVDKQFQISMSIIIWLITWSIQTSTYFVKCINISYTSAFKNVFKIHFSVTDISEVCVEF